MSPVFPMPAFNDPHNPEAAGGSINFGVTGESSFDDHPMKHADGYGGLYRQEAQADEGWSDDGDGRDDWTKDQWVDLAKVYALPYSGTKDELVARVEEHEATLEKEGN